MNINDLDTATSGIVNNINARVGLLHLQELSTAQSGGNNKYWIKQPYGAICLIGAQVT